MDALHSLLRRQLRRCFGNDFPVPAEWSTFVAAVNAAYREADEGREMIERSLELSSQELLQANSEMSVVFQAIPDLLLRIDRSGLVLEVKAGAAEDTVLQPSTLRGKHIQHLQQESVGQSFETAIQHALEQRVVTTIDYTSLVQGHKRTYEARFAPLRDDQLIVIIRNITERERSEAMRAGQNRIMERIATGAPLEETLASIARLVEAQTDDMLCVVLLADTEGSRLPACIAPSLPARLSEAPNGIPIGDGERHKTLAERYGLYACWSAPIHTGQDSVLGEVTSFCKAPRQATAAEIRLMETACRLAGIALQRAQAERNLRQAERKFRDIFEHAIEGIFQCTPGGRFLEANPALARMFGYTSAEELRNTVVDIDRQLFVEPAQFAALATEARERGVIQHRETEMRRKDGRKTWISLNLRLAHHPDDGAVYFEGSAEDVTEHRQLEAQFRQAQKMEAFGQLAGGVAHDFNNLLTVIQAGVSMSQTEDVSETDRKHFLEEARRAIERASNLTRQLLTFSRRQPLEPKPVDLNAVVVDVTQMLRRLIGEHIHVETRCSQEAAVAHADPGMMEQVLMNLAINARDAMPDGGRLVVETAIEEISAEQVASRPKARAGRYVRLNVADTGAGIAPEHLPHIFEPFFTTKEIGKGTGLGLATVFGIVEQHQGWIEIDSRVGAGTTFRIFLPHEPDANTMARETQRSLTSPAGREAILLVEDEERVRELMGALLERQGYRVHMAQSGVAALQLWQHHDGDFDLLITDLVMPDGIDGCELSDRLLDEEPSLKILHITGYAVDTVGRSSPLRGTRHFLEKPFSVESLLTTVRTCLDA